MSHEYDIPEDDLAMLADKHHIIFREAFYEQMNITARYHAIAKSFKNDDKKQLKGQLNKLKPKAVALIKALNGFDNALHGFDKLSENPAQRYMGVRLYRDRDKDKDLPEAHRASVMADAESWLKAVTTAFDVMGNLKTGGGAANKELLNTLVLFLIAAYKKGGLTPRSSTVEKENTGPLFRFIVHSFEVLNVETDESPEQLGNRIRNYIKKNKKLIEELPGPT